MFFTPTAVASCLNIVFKKPCHCCCSHKCKWEMFSPHELDLRVKISRFVLCERVVVEWSTIDNDHELYQYFSVIFVKTTTKDPSERTSRSHTKMFTRKCFHRFYSLDHSKVYFLSVVLYVEKVKDVI